MSARRASTSSSSAVKSTARTTSVTWETARCAMNERTRSTSSKTGAMDSGGLSPASGPYSRRRYTCAMSDDHAPVAARPRIRSRAPAKRNSNPPASTTAAAMTSRVSKALFTMTRSMTSSSATEGARPRHWTKNEAQLAWTRGRRKGRRIRMRRVSAPASNSRGESSGFTPSMVRLRIQCGAGPGPRPGADGDEAEGLEVAEIIPSSASRAGR